MGWDVIIHSSAGILSLVLGAMMVLNVFPWATDAFSIMMVIAFVSSVLISWWTSSWVRGHFLAMAPLLVSHSVIWVFPLGLKWPMDFFASLSRTSYIEASCRRLPGA